MSMRVFPFVALLIQRNVSFIHIAYRQGEKIVEDATCNSQRQMV